MFKNNSTSYDYDLFIFLPWGLKIHIATAGAKIPKYLIDLTKNNLRIYDHISNDPFEYKTEQNLRLETIVYEKEFIKNADFNTDNYLSSFKKFASKGFYSFDKTNINDPLDREYHLVAYPVDKPDFYFEKASDFVYFKENQNLLKRRNFSISLLNADLNTFIFAY